MSSNEQKYLHLKKQMNNGMIAEIIAYHRNDNIDVKFEDGTVVYKKELKHFLEGIIKNPLVKTHKAYHPEKSKVNCLGETRMMNNGMNATCIAFRKAIDIDVQFEDGYIVEHTRRQQFYAGKIANLNLGKYFTNRKSVLNETILMNNGQYAKCIAYRGTLDLDVQFEDGTVVEHKQKVHFLSGSIENPNWRSQSLPERLIYEVVKKIYPDAEYEAHPDFMKSTESGLNLEIDVWIPSIKIGIEYDGYPWHSDEKPSFIEKAKLFEKRDEIRYICTILEMGALVHKGPKHLNYQLSYTSSRRREKFYNSLEFNLNKLLKDIGISNPNVHIDDELINYVQKQLSNDFLGTSRQMNCGMVATCISYRSADDIDVQFEDGTIIEHRSKGSFMRGNIANPSLGVGISRIKDYVGESMKMNCGMVATIIRSNGNADIDVRFEDDTIVKNKTYDLFSRGQIANPTLGMGYTQHMQASVDGIEVEMHCGMRAKCIADRGCSDIDVLFEDGTLVKSASRDMFKRGVLSNPNIDSYANVKKKSSVLGQTRVMQNGMKATCIRYVDNTDIDVQFEDGTIVCHKTKGCFMRGCICNPSFSKQQAKINHASCLGEERVMHCGLKAICIAYRNSGDIDVQFENGVIRYHIAKNKFVAGAVAPNNKRKRK